MLFVPRAESWLEQITQTEAGVLLLAACSGGGLSTHAPFMRSLLSLPSSLFPLAIPEERGHSIMIIESIAQSHLN